LNYTRFAIHLQSWPPCRKFTGIPCTGLAH
jgi:hypothetical protein